LHSLLHNAGEELHSMLATRYKLPLVSARDAAYDHMYSGQAAQLASALGATYEQLMRDQRHPTVLGSKLYGRGLAAWAARQLLTAELTAISMEAAAGQPAVDLLQPLPLPRPVSPLAAQSADLLSFCAEGMPLKHLVNPQQVDAQGWQWSVSAWTRDCSLPNCRMLGYLGYGDGAHIDLTINTATVLAAATAATSNQQADIKLSLMLFYATNTPVMMPRLGFKRVKARAECVRGCSCTGMLLDASDSAAMLPYSTTEVRHSLGLMKYTYCLPCTAAQCWQVATCCGITQVQSHGPF
jgi:hypothetical protein